MSEDFSGVCIQGLLTAMSHTFHTNPRTFIVELQNEDGLFFIQIKLGDQLSWENDLEIGRSYSFTDVCLTRFEYQNKQLDMWVPTCHCECALKMNVPVPDTLYVHSSLKNYKGKVTHVEPLLSIYELDNKVEVCLAFLDMRSSCPRLCLDQEVTVYNAHIVTTRENKKCFLLCGRSYIKIHTHKDKSLLVDGSVPLATAVAHAKIGYPDFIMFKKLIPIFEEKFSDDFIKAIGSRDPQEVRLELFVQTIMNLSYIQKYSNNESLIMEFLSSPHHCVVPHKAHLYPMLTTVEDCVNQVAKEAFETNSTSFWYRKVVPQLDTESILVGFLSVSGQTGGWVLSDVTRKVDCIISGPNDTMPDVSNLLCLNKAMVLVQSYTLILEEFQTKKDDISNVETKVYLHFTTSDIRWLLDPRWVEEEPVLIKLDPNKSLESQKNETLDLLDPRRRGSPIVIDDELSQTSKTDSIVRPSQKSIKPCRTQRVLLHQKSAIMKECKNNPPQCGLLVSLIVRTSQQLDDATSLDTTAEPAKRYIIVIKGQLLKLVPFLLTGNMYSIILPSDFQFEQLFKMSKPNTLFNVLPHVGVVQLPRGANIHLVKRCPLRITSYQDWYSIIGLQDILHSEIINVEGILYDRMHISPSFSCEFRNLDLLGFGIPDMKTVILKLKDVAGEETICLYINNWANHQYPLGMVPGAHICATFVKRIITSKSNYLVSTTLTNIHILSVSTIFENDRLRDLDLESLLHSGQPITHGSKLWTILCPYELRVELSAACSQCHSLIVDNQCTFRGCWLKDSVTIVAKAICVLDELAGQVIIHFKDDHVRVLLGIPVHIWEMLAQYLGKQSGTSLKYNSEKDEEEVVSHSLADEVFQLYCSAVPQQRRFHVKCRVMKWDNSIENDGAVEEVEMTPRLFCLDIQEVNSNMSHQLGHALSLQEA